MDMNMNWLWAMIILPVIAGIFKKELSDLYNAYGVYRHRPFDLDRDPGTADVCMLNNPATGDWGLVIIHKYAFWHWSQAKRGVIFSHITDDGVLKRHVGLIEWGRLAKAKIMAPLSTADSNFLSKHEISWSENKG